MQLVADNLTVKRGERTILSGVSFRVESGQALVLTGPNGSGKTTLLRTIAGFLGPSRGRVMLEGGPDGADIAGQCHYVGHANAVKSAFDVAENVAFWSRYLDATASADQAGQTSRALDAFGLTGLASIPAAYLSAGQKRRLGLARLLTAVRPVWLLDEPTVSLDQASVALLAGHIEQHLAKAGIVVAATHVPLGLAKSRELRLGAPA